MSVHYDSHNMKTVFAGNYQEHVKMNNKHSQCIGRSEGFFFEKSISYRRTQETHVTQE